MTSSSASRLLHLRSHPRLEKLREADDTIGIALLGFVAFTLPFEFTRRFFPIEWIDVSRIGIVAAVAWFAWRARRAPREIRLPSWALFAAVGLLICVVLASFLVTRWPNATKEIAAIVAYAALAVVACNVVRTRAELAFIAACVLASGVLVGALGVAEQLGNFYLWKDRPLEVLSRRNSTFADPNIAARFYLLCVVIALGALASSYSRSKAVVGGAFVVLTVLAAALVYTGSRTGLGLLVIVVLPWLFLAIRFRLREVLRGALLVVAVVVGVFIVNPGSLARAGDVPVASELQPVRAGPIATRTSTFVDPLLAVLPLDEVRQYLIRAGVAMFEDSPLAGVGVGGFQPEILGPYRGFIPPSRLSAPTSLQHTELVRVAAENGVVGIALYLSILAAAWAALWRWGKARARDDQIAAFTLGFLLLIIALSSQMEGRFYTEPYLWLILGLGSGLAANMRVGDVVRSVRSRLNRPSQESHDDRRRER